MHHRDTTNVSWYIFGHRRGDTSNKLPMNWRELRRISHLYHPVLVKNCLYRTQRLILHHPSDSPWLGFSLKEVGFCAANGHPKMMEFTGIIHQNEAHSRYFQMIASPNNICHTYIYIYIIYIYIRYIRLFYQLHGNHL